MTARDDARSRHPSNSGVPALPPRGRDTGHHLARQRRRVYLWLSTFTLGFVALSTIKPMLAILIALWVLFSIGTVGFYIGVCEAVRWVNRRRWVRHTEQALRNVQ